MDDKTTWHDLLLDNLQRHFSPGSLEGVKLLLTAGPTREAIDAEAAELVEQREQARRALHAAVRQPLSRPISPIASRPGDDAEPLPSGSSVSLVCLPSHRRDHRRIAFVKASPKDAPPGGL